MEWSERMNAALDYIEDNLTGELDFSEAANLALCSLFHFQRIFLAVTGSTPAEYARRRRLTLAARDLSAENTRVLDIALKYGYDSPDAFTRAFRNMHGITPQAARGPGPKLVAFPRISFHVMLKGGNDMDYRIIEKPAFEAVAKGRKFSAADGQNFMEIPKFWENFCKHDDGEKALMKMTGGKPGPGTGADLLGLCVSIDPTLPEFTYAIGAEKSAGTLPAGFEIIQVPAATWAVFESIGPMPDAIQTVTKQIFSEWFPSTGYEHAAAPELEVYLPGDPNSADYHCQVWIPIIKNKK